MTLRSQPYSITPSDIAHMPAPGLDMPVKVAFSHDGTWLAWLHSGSTSLQRDLYLHNVASGETFEIDSPATRVDESSLSIEEKLRRERTRDVGQGITNYSWFPRHNRVIVPTAHEVWVYDVETTVWEKALDIPSAVIVDPQVSCDGQQLAWVQDGALMVAPIGGSPRSLSVPESGITHGLADYLAQEEMGRSHGFWWSPDGKAIAYQQTDERHVPLLRIDHLGADDPAEHEEHRYPFAGAENPRVKLFVVDLASHLSVEVDLGGVDYLARVRWSDNNQLYVHTLDRLQQKLVLHCFQDGEVSPLLAEEQAPWINLNDAFRLLEDGRFLQASERSGFNHLEVVDGNDVRPITRGEWIVDGVAGVEGEMVYFTGTREAPTERHLYRTTLAGDDPVRLTESAGMHNVVVDRSARHFVDLHSALDRPPRLDLLTTDGRFVRTLVDQTDERIVGLKPPELTTVTTAEGVVLHCAIYRPDGEEEKEGPFPTVDSLYGGPHAQLVTNSWALTANLRAQYLRRKGICVVVVDNRGSARRGLAFEAVIHRRLGGIEVQDHVTALREFSERGIVDLDHVGVYGWSYGGYLSAMCLAKAGEIYKVAVAGAPVTHWDGYDTCYTERYMGTPRDNEEGYRDSSVMAHVGSMAGKLMIVHGLLDENVHFRHTARLINVLLEAGVDHKLMLYPNERHLPRSQADRTHMETAITEFLLEGIA